MFTFYCLILPFIMAVSLASINVNGVAERHKRVRVFECLRAMPVNLFFLQETHLVDHSQGKMWEKEWGVNARGLPAQIDPQALRF